MRILVAGGGTAGLIAATILKKRFNFTVDLVRSSEIGIVGVGEGSTEHFKEYLNFLQIDPYEVISETDATYKVGIMFNGWGDKDYLHNVHDDFSVSSAQYHHAYAKQISENSEKLSPISLNNNLLNSWFLNRKEFFPANQFHFDTNKLNSYLTSIAKSMGVNFYDDEILDVKFSESGEISEIVGKENVYRYDFYVDATGFKKILIGKMGAKWVSFSDHLKMNSAIAFQTEPNESNINLWTTATAMDYGWMFNLPTWNHQGNGYIYDSNYIDQDSAVREAEKFLGRQINVGRSFSFDPGYLDRVWINNCVAIGLSGSFVEPLEATSIGTSIQQSFLLIHKLSNYNKKDIDSYNSLFKSIMENIRDFVFLHYITNKTNTSFWRDVSHIPLPPFLEEKLETWKNRLPNEEDFVGISRYKMFGPKNFIVVMHGLGMFNNESIKKELSSMNDEIIYDAQKVINDSDTLDNIMVKISHKKFIEFVRNSHRGFVD